MTKENYISISGILFALVAVAHFFRAINGWPVRIGDWDLPVWVSWLAVVVVGYLAWWALGRRK